MRQTTRLPRKNSTTARTPVDMDISALLRSAQQLEAAASALSDMEHDVSASEELNTALRHNRQIWSVFLGSAGRNDTYLDATIRKAMPSMNSQVMQQTRNLEKTVSVEDLQALVDVNRSLASDLQRSKAA